MEATIQVFLMLSQSFDFEGTKTNLFKVCGSRTAGRELNRVFTGGLVIGFGDFAQHLIVYFDSPVVQLGLDAKLMVAIVFGLIELLERAH